MDVKESDNSNDVATTFELPDIKLEDVTIDLQQNRLTVSGLGRVHCCGHSRDRRGYAVREHRSGKLSRTLQIFFGTKAEDVKAKMENGILTDVPKIDPNKNRIALRGF